MWALEVLSTAPSSSSSTSRSKHLGSGPAVTAWLPSRLFSLSFSLFMVPSVSASPRDGACDPGPANQSADFMGCGSKGVMGHPSWCSQNDLGM